MGKKLLLPSFRDCLKERGTVQMLTIGREAAIEVQVRYILSCRRQIHEISKNYNYSEFSMLTLLVVIYLNSFTKSSCSFCL